MSCQSWKKGYKNTETMLFGIASAMNTEGKKTTA